MAVGGLIDLIVRDLQARFPYGRVVKKPNGSIALLIDTNGLKRILAEAIAKSRKNQRADVNTLMSFMDIAIRGNYIEISIKLL